MKADYATPIDAEIKLRYVVIHSTNNLEALLKEAFEEVAPSYGIAEITGLFQSDIISLNQDSNEEISIVEIHVVDMAYSRVREFENTILSEDGILEVCKVYDSFKMEENRELLTELYNIEMKIREIYTVLARLQGVNLERSTVKLLREYEANKEDFKNRLMNEFFFIEFSDYKNVDKRKDAKLGDLLDVLRQIRRVKDINTVVTELSYPTLHIEERFNELARIPEAIGRLEKFRNNIAHNRYTSANDIENFRKAKGIIDGVYNDFLAKLKSGRI